MKWRLYSLQTITTDTKTCLGQRLIQETSMIKILILFLLSGVSGVFGRMGGSGNYPRQVRVIGIPILLSVILWFLGVHNLIVLFLFCGLSIGAISTYWDFTFNKTDNFWIHGAFIGLASFPITIVNHNWELLLIRVLVIALYIGLVHLLVKNAVKEEFLRYMILPLTLLLV